MTKHTPGPWHVFRVSEYLIIGESPPAPGRHIARASSMGDETEANARLIAAAPAMLEALQALTKRMEGVIRNFPATTEYQATGRTKDMEAARAAIALATDDTE